MFTVANLRRSAIPLYTQIASSLRNEIDMGTWPVGTKMPAIHQLADRFGVAAQTMRQAIGLLEGEGLVLRRQGVGTVVQYLPRDLRWLNLPTDWVSLVGMLDKLDVRVMLVEASDRMPKVRESEGRPVGAYKYVKRVHYRNDEPFCVVEFYLAAEVYLRAPKMFRKSTVIPVLAKMKNVDVFKVGQSISIGVADAETAKQLDIPLANPVARVRRSICDKKGNAIYIAEALYRSDVIHIDMDLSPGRKGQ
ncbi:MAG: hypothetical protein APF80_04935 [Alphaproteobacteria bacterium BRH_c36]|nr:MAG: hypothetical protein APF80_04935 [Alphaproteobacteria bacterium BRH_c36]